MTNKAKEEFLSLQDVVMLLPGRVYWKNKKGEYIGANNNFLENLGLNSLSELKGKTDYDFLEKKLADKVQQNDQQIIAENKPQTFEEEVISKDHFKAIYVSRKTPLHNNKGGVIGVIGISINITENKKKIEKLEENFVKQLMVLNKVIAMSPGHIYWTDEKGVLLGCNEQQAKDLDLPSRESIVGETLYGLQPDDLAVTLHENNMQVINEGVDYTLEEQANFNGQMATCLSHKMPMRDNKGNIIGLVGVSIDITDRKKAEEYRIKNEAAQKVITFTNLIATSMAHEFRTPLQGIGCQAEAIEGTLNSKNLTPQQKDNGLREIAKIIKGVVNAASNTVNEMLLKIRSFAAGKLPQQGFTENSIATDIENFLGAYPFERDQENLVRVSYGTKFKYIGDKSLTHHLLNSLLKNALTAVKNSDRDKCEITIETKSKGNSNLLIFKDNATGIPEDFIDKVFDQFETINTTDGGSGLGLSFCKMVMGSYGGSIVCNSKEGKYTEFVLSFPKI